METAWMHATGSGRRLAVRLHRWAGLALGGWFALAGLTGSVLVWHAELDAALNPRWFAPRPACAAAAAQPVAAALAVHARATRGAAAQMVAAPHAPGAAHVVWEHAAAGAPRRQHFVDAGCGLHLGSREWGAARADRAHVVPALYELHRSLLAGPAGHTAVGLAGLLLLATALAGLAVAWPRTASAAAWRRAFSVRRGGPPARRWYELHRATGLWLLPFLLLIAVTGVYLCFPQQGRALAGTLMPTLPGGLAPPAAGPKALPVGAAPGPDDLVAVAESLWPDARWSRIALPATAGAYHEVRLLQRGEPRADTGDTRVRLAADGTVLAVRDALRAPAGERLLGWLFPLHSAEALGFAGRLAWTACGTAPALLFATGAWLWWRRQAARRRVGALPTRRPDPFPTREGACE